MSESILIGIDLAAHADIGVIALMERLENAGVKLVIVASEPSDLDRLAVDFDAVVRQLGRNTRLGLRHGGYSQSHWRKIMKGANPPFNSNVI